LKSITNPNKERAEGTHLLLLHHRPWLRRKKSQGVGSPACHRLRVREEDPSRCSMRAWAPMQGRSTAARLHTSGRAPARGSALTLPSPPVSRIGHYRYE